VDEIGGDELGQKAWHDIGEENDALGDISDEILGGREDDDIENIIDETCDVISSVHATTHLQLPKPNGESKNKYQTARRRPELTCSHFGKCWRNDRKKEPTKRMAIQAMAGIPTTMVICPLLSLALL
jgi:hypothetical protein